MTVYSIQCVSFLLILFAVVHIQAQYKRVCYYTNWAQYRPGEGKYFPEDIDPSLCSHIVYAFAKLNGNRLVAFEWNDESTEWMKGMYARYNEIKFKNPEVKTLLAVGGWNMASAPFTAMVATPATRREFATSTVTFLRERNFDGVDIDWEYPANRGSPPEDRDRYTQLVRETRRAFDEEARRTGRPALLLTSAVAAGKSKIDSAYDIPQVCRDMDFISLMAYDLHGSWENKTGHNSPLYAHAGETGDERFLNMDWSSNYWARMGCPKEKLIIGMGLYGRSFTLRDRNNNGLMAPAKGKGEPGKYTREGGFLAYYEICDIMKKGGQSYYIKEQEVPYAVLNDQWVGYDDVDSLRLKVQWMKQSGFGGVMVWALDLDDFKGWCGQGKYPLLKAINQELLSRGRMRPIKSRPNRVSPSRTQLPAQRQQPTRQLPPAPRQPQRQVPVPQQPQRQQPRPQPSWNKPKQAAPRVTPPPPAPQQNVPQLTTDFKCPSNSNKYYASPKTCHEYYICASGLSFKFTCQPPLRWNATSNFCDWPDNVPCTKGGASTGGKRPNTWGTNTRPSNTRATGTGAANRGPPQRPQRMWPQRPAPTTRRPTTTTTRRTTTTTRAPAPVTRPPWMNWSLWIAEFWKALAAMTASPQSWIQQNGANALLPPPAVAAAAMMPTPKPVSNCVGKRNGLHPDLSDCTKYIDCVQGTEYKGSCPTGTAFDTISGVCDYINKVQRCRARG